MTRLDKKKDGKLTKDEVPPRLWEGFTKAGVVKDRVVTKQGVEAALKKLREQYRPGGPGAKPGAKPQGGPGGPHAGGPAAAAPDCPSCSSSGTRRRTAS